MFLHFYDSWKTWSPLRHARNDDLLAFIYSRVVKSLFRSSTAFRRNNRYTKVPSAREILLYNQIRFDPSACIYEGSKWRTWKLARIPPPKFRFIRENEAIDRRNRNCISSRAFTSGKISRFGQVRGESKSTFVAWNQRNDSRIISKKAEAWK